MSETPDIDQPDGPEFDELPERLEKPESDDEGMNLRLVVGVLVTAAVLGFLVVDGLGSETYFFSVEEAVAKSESLVDETIRVKGKVVEGTIVNEDEGIGRRFDIAAKGETMTIQYDKAVPDTFKEGVQVVATGTLKRSGTLHAKQLLVKCPSRYEGKPPTAGEGKGPRAGR